MHYTPLFYTVICTGTILDRIDYNMETAVEHAKEGVKYIIYCSVYDMYCYIYVIYSICSANLYAFTYIVLSGSFVLYCTVHILPYTYILHTSLSHIIHSYIYIYYTLYNPVGIEQLHKAEESQKNSLPVRCIILLVLLIIIMVIVLIVKHSPSSSSSSSSSSK